MKRITLTICAAAFLFCSCNDTKTTDEKTATADSGKMSTDTTSKMNTQAMAAPMDSASMMKAWMAYMTPGPVQAMIAKSNGTWDEDVTMWMDPSKPPTMGKATATNKMIMGGRYQELHSSGTFMGMPFEGMGIMGYDNAKKIIISTWIDNMGTGMLNMEGTYDSTTHMVTLRGKSTDPSTGKDMDERQTFTMIDDNHQKIEMFQIQNGKENKVMEIALKRK
ncbi:MAG: DUF1579 domain-containing protein [Chitinophagaceae bacterium]|nr:DUF1579 domain-containing protein [Chitinophagaceae bacterium]